MQPAPSRTVLAMLSAALQQQLQAFAKHYQHMVRASQLSIATCSMCSPLHTATYTVPLASSHTLAGAAALALRGCGCISAAGSPAGPPIHCRHGAALPAPGAVCSALHHPVRQQHALHRVDPARQGPQQPVQVGALRGLQFAVALDGCSSGKRQQLCRQYAYRPGLEQIGMSM